MGEHTLRLPDRIRDRLREMFPEHTYTEALLEVLPEAEPENVVVKGETVWIEIDSPAHKRLDELTGEGATYGDVVEHYLNEYDDD